MCVHSYFNQCILKKAFTFNVKITKGISRSKHIVRNYLKLGQKYGLKPKIKGNQKLSRRAIRKVIYEATRKRLSASQIKVDLDLSVTKRLIQLANTNEETSTKILP